MSDQLNEKTIEINEVKNFEGKTGFFKMKINMPEELIIKQDVSLYSNTSIPDNLKILEYTKKIEEQEERLKKTEAELAKMTELISKIIK